MFNLIKMFIHYKYIYIYMSNANINFNADITAKTITSTVRFVGSGTGLINIPRSGIDAGTPSHVIINGGDGRLFSEAYLSQSRGG